MVAFDPRLALEILQRRRQRFEDEGTYLGGQVYVCLWNGYVNNPEFRKLEERRDAAYRAAHDMQDVLQYLIHRIAEEER